MYRRSFGRLPGLSLLGRQIISAGLSQFLTVTVLFQSSSKADGISALTGGKSASASAAEAKSNNAKLARITKVLAIVFFVVTLAVYALTIYL